jgi:hypothetical protein
VDYGSQEGSYNGKPTKPKRKIAMRFELHGDTQLPDGRRCPLARPSPCLPAPRARYEPFMEGWRGKSFTDNEFEAFDLRNMLGKPAIITVVEDGEYRVINGCSRLLAGMQAPAQVNPSLFFSLDEYDPAVFDKLSDKVKELIQKSPEWKALNGLTPPQGHPAADPLNPFDEQEIPF